MKTWAERRAAGYVRPKTSKGGKHRPGYRRPNPPKRSAKAKAKPKCFLDRPIVFWDGEGLTTEQQTGPSRADFRRGIETTARAEYHSWDARYASLLEAVAQHGGLERSSFDSPTMYDGIPKRFFKPKHLCMRASGNADLIAQTAEGLDGIPRSADDVLDDLAHYRTKPSLKAIREQVEAENAHRAPNPGRHLYCLLASLRTDRDAFEYVEDYERGLSTKDCFEFLLASAAENPRAIHVGFALHYDFDMMLGDLAMRDVRRLRAASKGGIRVSVDGRAYKVTYRPRKFLRIADAERSITLYDAFGFFQASFVRACDDWLDERTKANLGLDSIHNMKLRRAQFTASDREAILAYCKSELRAGVALIWELIERVKATGLPLQRLDGAGALAGAIMRTHDVKSAIAPDPLDYREAIASAYFGGRIEAMGVGYHNDVTYEHDIRSAYPAAIATLPDLAGAQWTRGVPGVRTLYHVRWDLCTQDAGRTIPFFPLPYRLPNDGVIFPARGEGWVWCSEYRAALSWIARFGGDVDVLDCIGIAPIDESARPFAFVPELYDQRAQWKDAGIGAEKVLKLGLNSLYGRMAQQVGAIVTPIAVKPPPYFSLAWAGMVTAHTRAALVTAALDVPYDVLMFMTDGLYAKVPIALDFSKALGAWEQSHMDAVVIAQPGVYWKRHGDTWEPKVRGFGREGLETPDAVLDVWRRGARDLTVPTTRFVTSGTAIASLAAWKTWRRWITEPRVLDVTGDTLKREGLYTLGRRGSRRADREFLFTRPRPNLLDGASKPYDVEFWRGARKRTDVDRLLQDEIEMLTE
jgi:hypothetical protein